MKTIKVKDLKDQIGTVYPRPFLKCAVCGDESSAHRGDYFTFPLEHVFACCDEPMLLVTKATVYTEVA